MNNIENIFSESIDISSDNIFGDRKIFDGDDNLTEELSTILENLSPKNRRSRNMLHYVKNKYDKKEIADTTSIYESDMPPNNNKKNSDRKQNNTETIHEKENEENLLLLQLKTDIYDTIYLLNNIKDESDNKFEIIDSTIQNINKEIDDIKKTQANIVDKLNDIQNIISEAEYPNLKLSLSNHTNEIDNIKKMLDINNKSMENIASKDYEQIISSNVEELKKYINSNYDKLNTRLSASKRFYGR